LRNALSLLLRTGASKLTVLDERAAVGVLTLEHIRFSQDRSKDVSYIIKNPGIVWDLLLEHLQMTSLALLIAVLVALPLSPADYPLPLAECVPVMGTLERSTRCRAWR